MFNTKYKAGLVAAVAAACVAAPSWVQAASQPIYLEANQSYYLPQSTKITRVAVTNPKVADVNVINHRAINIVGLAPGTTSLTVWTANGMRQEFMINVSANDSEMARAIQKAINLPHVQVQVVNKKVLLRGTVANQYEKNLAYRIACIYEGGTAAPTVDNASSMLSSSGTSGSGYNINDNDENNPNVVDLLEMVNPDQINIEAEVIEINSSDAKQLGAAYAGNSISSISIDKDGGRSADATIGATEGGYQFNTEAQMRDKGSNWLTKNWFYTHSAGINAQIHALITKGKARVISRPNITTMSGHTAGILIGGQIPYPVTDKDGNTTVTQQPYGIQLNLFKPSVDRENNITSRIFAGVSSIDWGNAVTSNGNRWPALSTRSAETMVNIPSGMTMVIGGLLDSNQSRNLSKVPLLGDIPIIGELFKYHNNSGNKSEIMILITPRVVNETTPVSVSTDMRDFYTESKQEDEERKQLNTNAPVPSKVEFAKQKKEEQKAEAEKQKQEKEAIKAIEKEK